MKRHHAVPNNAVPASISQAPPERLLILGCSKAKSAEEELVPALQRYEGPPFLVLRRYLRLRQDDLLCIYILSAEFGLISANYLTPNYDRRMTQSRAEELRSEVADQITQLFDQMPQLHTNHDQLLVLLGKDYQPALAGCSEQMLSLLYTRCASGGQGKKLTHLHDWLYGPIPKVGQ